MATVNEVRNIEHEKKLAEILMEKPYGHSTYEEMAHFLVVNGARVPVLCGKCEHGTPEMLHDDRIWCTRICRYMKKNGYCSEGEPKHEKGTE